MDMDLTHRKYCSQSWTTRKKEQEQEMQGLLVPGLEGYTYTRQEYTSTQEGNQYTATVEDS
jgi:hypothetical protein